ncbi:MAG: hypothetical protein ACLPZJ_00780, partial [Terriglobales bacterium]
MKVTCIPRKKNPIPGAFVIAVTVALTGGVLGCLLAVALVTAMTKAPGMGFFFLGMHVTFTTFLLALVVAGMVGLLSAII